MQSLWCFYYYLYFKSAHAISEIINLRYEKIELLLRCYNCQNANQDSTNAFKQFFINKPKTVRNVNRLFLTCLLISVSFWVHHVLVLMLVYGLLFSFLLDKF